MVAGRWEGVTVLADERAGVGALQPALLDGARAVAADGGGKHDAVVREGGYIGVPEVVHCLVALADETGRGDLAVGRVAGEVAVAVAMVPGVGGLLDQLQCVHGRDARERVAGKHLRIRRPIWRGYARITGAQSPRRAASAASSARLRTPILAKTLRRWVRTVPSLMSIWAAMSGLLSPAVVSATTSRSVRVRLPHPDLGRPRLPRERAA